MVTHLSLVRGSLSKLSRPNLNILILLVTVEYERAEDPSTFQFHLILILLESKSSRNGLLHTHRCLLVRKYLFQGLEALIRKTRSHLKSISCTVGVSCRSFPTKQILHSSDFAMSFGAACNHLTLCIAQEITFRDDEMLKKAYGNNSTTGGFLTASMAEMKLKEHCFVDSDELIQNVTKQLKGLSKAGFQEGFEQL
ncbi:hypothetical protein TNCV_2363811 [Trichonephila clavipes]|nr:hypothetical protein TNCV_2363811 [Trichonephila clavipes]